MSGTWDPMWTGPKNLWRTPWLGVNLFKYCSFYHIVNTTEFCCQMGFKLLNAILITSLSYNYAPHILWAMKFSLQVVFGSFGNGPPCLQWLHTITWNSLVMDTPWLCNLGSHPPLLHPFKGLAPSMVMVTCLLWIRLTSRPLFYIYLYSLF